MMHYNILQIILFAYYILQITESTFVFNVTSTNNLLCYSCKGSSCETASSNGDNIIACDKNTQICWSGFIDQQPYRTCASRFCTPNGISLDSDIRIELCCHSTLCNSNSLALPIWSKWFTKASNTTESPKKPTTDSGIAKAADPRKIYIANEFSYGPIPVAPETKVEEEKPRPFRINTNINQSDPSSFGITWPRLPFGKDTTSRAASISKFFVLVMPIVMAFLI